MKLYLHPTSPFCRVAKVVLAEKALPFETVEILRGSDRPRLLELSPRGQLPVLDTEGGVVTGSLGICEFAEARHPEPPLLPEIPEQRAACHRLTEIASSTTDALQFLTHLLTERRPELVDERPGCKAQLDDEVRAHYAYLEAKLAGGPFFAGSFSRADLYLYMMVTSLQFMGHALPGTCPGLTAWVRELSRRPCVRDDTASVLRAEAATRNEVDPFFRADRIHWRNHRVEWACRLGLGDWLHREIEGGRAFFSPPPRSPHA